MRKKLLCTVAAVAMLSGLFVVAATPAFAVPPTDTQNFLPDDTPEGSVVGTFLSDKEDGTDQLAHLTNVSTRETSEVRWFLCPEDRFTTTGQQVTDNDQLNGCDAAGTDNSPVTPEEGPGEGTDPPEDFTDEAYEIFFPIPAGLDGDTVDVVAAACTNSAAPDFEDDPPTAPPASNDERNCTSDVENDVILDDGQTGVQGAQTSAGEITGLCAISATSSADCELEDGPDSGTQPDPDPEVDANFIDFGHGSNIPNDRFTIRATSSIDVTLLNAFLTEPADAENDPNGSYTEVDCEEIDSDSNSREWQCTLTNVRDNAEQELAIFDESTQAGTGGNCTNPATLCKLDAHYVVSQTRRAEEAVLSFARQGSSTEDRDISLNAGCDDPDTADTNQVDNLSHLVGCFFDQFGARRVSADDDEASFESEGVGEFDAFSEDCDDPHDHDDDGFVEHCHSDEPAGDNGEFDVEVTSAETGDQTITFCLDEENEGPEGSPPTDHGCADETVTATATKSWGSGVANEVTLVFDDGDGDRCEGDTFRENRVNQTDTLIACVFDEEGNPVDTNDADADGQLQWFITEGADDQTDTRFSETPPQETEEGNEADVGLQAVDRGTDIITVELQNDDGDFQDSDSVEKQVERRRRARSTVSIRHRGRPHRFVGRVTSPRDSCEPGRRVRVRRVRPGRDPVIGSDTTNANGRYRVNHNRTRRRFRYYAQVRGNANCRPGTSDRTPRVR